MLQPNNSSVLSTVSPPESGFHPRREFVRDSHVSSTFSLLSIVNVGSVRLTSFAPEVIEALGKYFDSRKILLGVREEPKLNVLEFRLDGKPWAQSKKTVDAEKLFLDILAIVFQQGYRFLSTIDYGRESSGACSNPALANDFISRGSYAVQNAFRSHFRNQSLFRRLKRHVSRSHCHSRRPRFYAS